MRADQVQKVAVLGAGVMGHGIAQVAAAAGYSVTVRDIAQEFLDKAEEGVRGSLGKLVERGRLIPEEMNSTLGRIRFTVDLDEAVRDAQLIVEAIPEKMSIKHSVWKEVASKAPKDAILASNTSSLSITEIAEVVSFPSRFIGMHFFNPPALMRLVEVNQGAKTSPETVEAVMELAVKMGKTPVHVKRDSPGFIVNRVLITYINEAAKLLTKYSVQQIDAAMQHKAGMPMGPFMLSDLIGLDIVHDILRVFEEKLGPAYTPDKHIVDLYQAKKLGRKSGEGFYSYKERPAVSEAQAQGFDVTLLLKPFVAEADKLVKEGIASEADIDTAMKLGANIPKGPFEMKKAGLGEEKPVLTDKREGVYTITINRPSKVNSFTLEMLELVEDAVEEASNDNSIGCILIKGDGDRAFSAGADITGWPEFTEEQARKIPVTGHRVFRKILETPKPVVAAINGYCLGGGNELILYCDFRLASDKAKFSQSEVTLGLIPGWGGTYMLSRLVGKTLATEMTMTGRRLDADEALKAGLVTAVYQTAEFDSKVWDYAKKLVEGPPHALAAMKKLASMDPQLGKALKAEEEAFTRLWDHRELREGISAFNEKRKPKFRS
jgi:enoyl-CoA hydratase/3-hydroxyacyl-CoA dehydrogenase